MLYATLHNCMDTASSSRATGRVPDHQLFEESKTKLELQMGSLVCEPKPQIDCVCTEAPLRDGSGSLEWREKLRTAYQVIAFHRRRGAMGEEDMWIGRQW